MLEIVKAKKITTEIAGAYFVNGKAQMLFANYKQAVSFFDKALAKLSLVKKAQRGEWLTNLGKAKYLKGEKEKGLNMIFKGIHQLKKHSGDIDGYTFNIWLSGAYLRLAEILKQDRPTESANYLKQARTIIQPDAKQIIRKKQLANFVKSGLSGI